MRGDYVKAVLFDSLWAVDPDHAELLVQIADKWMEGGMADAPEPKAEFGRSGYRDLPYVSGLKDGVATVCLHGTMSPRMNLLMALSGGVSTELAARTINELSYDQAVKSILLDIDSPGGQVRGTQELADVVYDARSRKKITASINYLAASAAYWVASQANEIVASPSSSVGSIGVLIIHRTAARAADRVGVDISVLRVPQHKAEGNPFEQLSEEARKSILGQLTTVHNQFVSAVARGRGIKEDEVRAEYGEGRLVLAEDALATGMVDRVAPITELQGGDMPDKPGNDDLERRLAEAEARAEKADAKTAAADARAVKAESTNMEIKDLLLAERGSRRKADMTSKVMGWKNLGIKTDGGVVEALVEIEEKCEATTLKAVLDTLGTLNEQAKTADLTTEVGNKGGDANADPIEELENRSKALVVAGTVDNLVDARVEIQSKDRELVQRIREHRAVQAKGGK